MRNDPDPDLDPEASTELDPAVDLAGFPSEVESTIYEIGPFERYTDSQHILVRHCSACGSSEPHHLAYVEQRGICVV